MIKAIFTSYYFDSCIPTIRIQKFNDDHNNVDRYRIKMNGATFDLLPNDKKVRLFLRGGNICIEEVGLDDNRRHVYSPRETSISRFFYSTGIELEEGDYGVLPKENYFILEKHDYSKGR